MAANILIVLMIFIFVIVMFFMIIIIKFLRKPLKGRALIRTGAGGSKVILEGAVLVFPILHQLEEIDLTLKTFALRKTVYCKDNTTATLEVSFYLRVNNDLISVQEVATTIGAERTFDKEALKEIYEPKFAEAIKKVAAEYNSSALKMQQAALKLELLQAVGTNLDGYALDDCVVQSVEINNIA